MTDRPNAHNVTERGKALMRRLRVRAERRGLVFDATDLEWRRRVYRAARRIEDARTRRGDSRPFLADDYHGGQA